MDLNDIPSPIIIKSNDRILQDQPNSGDFCNMRNTCRILMILEPFESSLKAL